MTIQKGEIDQLVRWVLVIVSGLLITFWIRDSNLIPEGNAPLIIAILILLFVAYRYNIKKYSGR